MFQHGLVLLSFWLLMHSSVDGHLGRSSFLTAVSRATVNTHGQVFVWTHVVISFGRVPRGGTMRSYGNCSVFCGTSRLFSKGAASLYIPTSPAVCRGWEAETLALAGRVGGSFTEGMSLSTSVCRQ